MCGIAMVRLHITAEDFFDLSPVELYYAGKALGDQNDQEFKQKLLLSRVEAWMIGLASRTENFPETPADLIGFKFEAPKVQTVDQMKSTLLGIAGVQNESVERESKMRTDPPKVAHRKMKRTQKPK